MLAATDRTYRHTRLGRLGAVTLGLLLLYVIGAAPVAASTTHHITRGDVIAAFQARTTGGYVNAFAGRLHPAPVRGLHDGRINPFSGGEYCAADWHYLGITLTIERSHAAAVSYFGQTTFAFSIDGAPVSPLMYTPLKPLARSLFSGLWGESAGALLPPGSLAEGDHVLRTVVDSPDGPLDIEVPFWINADC